MTEALVGEERFNEVSEAFVEALRRVIRVSVEDDDGRPTAVTHARLSAEADVGRSTLAKYLSRNGSAPANPTLDLVCRLANSLGIPPAFLLMTADDWRRLGSAAISFAQMAADPRFEAFAGDAMKLQSASPQALAEAGQELARLLGLHEPAIPRDSVGAGVPRASAIAPTCAAPPFRDLSPVHIPALLALCTVIGASTNTQGA